MGAKREMWIGMGKVREGVRGTENEEEEGTERERMTHTVRGCCRRDLMIVLILSHSAP